MVYLFLVKFSYYILKFLKDVKKKMKKLTKNQQKNAESLQNLCKLLGIDIRSGWQKALADALDTSESTVSQWITRGISKNCFEAAERLGYESDLWHAKDGRPMYAEQLLDTHPPKDNPDNLISTFGN